MTKLLVWGTFIFLVGISVQYHDIFSKNCREAGGLPLLTVSNMVCLHPSSFIELRDK
jgi:hypothetical protein